MAAADPALTAASGVASTVAYWASSIAFMGLQPTDLTAPCIGALLGLAATESAKRTRSIALFVLSAPVSALAAKSAVPYLPAGNVALQHLTAVLIAAMFPVLFVVGRDALAARLPELLDGVLQVLGGKK